MTGDPSLTDRRPRHMPSATSDRHPVRHMQVEANGGSFHVVEQGEGPTVLFVHGFPDTWVTWRRQMQAVARAGYRAVALDVRGFGDSYAPDDPALYSATYIVGDLIGILDALRIETAVLVSHDWGADHAQRAMVMRPDRFRAIISLSIPFSPRGDLSTWDTLRERGFGGRYYAFDMMKCDMEDRIRAASRSIPSALYWMSGSPLEGTGWDPIDPSRDMFRPAPPEPPSWVDADYLRHNVETFARTGFRGGLNHYRGVQATFDQLGAYKDVLIDQPSLYVWGGSDGLCLFFHPEPPTLDDARKRAPGLVGVVRLDGVGHWPHLEAPDRVNAEIVSFLRAPDGGEPPVADASGQSR